MKDMGSVLIQADALDTQKAFFQLQEQEADLLLTVKANPRNQIRHIVMQFQVKYNITFEAINHKINYNRDLTGHFARVIQSLYQGLLRELSAW